MDSKKKLIVLRDKWAGCTKCALAPLRGGGPIIFGTGSYASEFLIVTEAPSEHDVQAGAVLSGDEGHLISNLLDEAGIDTANVYRTSVVACRPYVVLPATDDSPERSQDRGADKTECEACWPRVQEIIYLIDPKIIIAMGDTPWKMLVSTKHRRKSTTIANAAGELFDTYIPGRLRNVRYPVLATLSARQLIANPSVALHGPMATTLEALIKAAKYINNLKKEDDRER